MAGVPYNDGYEKYKHGIFRVRLIRDWNYVVTGARLVDELRRAPEDVLSLGEATAVILQSDYTLRDWRTASPVDLVIIQTKLNRKLEKIMPAAIEEIGAAFEDEITGRLTGNEWTEMTVGESIMRVVCRTSNRMFVGLPLCRDNEYVALTVQYAIDVIVSALILRNIPAFLKPVVARFFIPIRWTYDRAERIMSASISERLQGSRADDDERPDDYLQWAIDAGEPYLQSVPSLAAHILRLNFAAIHSTSVTFTFALYHLAAHPEEYQEPIRREAQAVLAEHGWTKTGIDHLHMLDSFLRESQRVHGIGAVAMDRKAMRDFTFSDGSVIKKGQVVTAAARDIHHDPAVYSNPERFDGFRFYSRDSSDVADFGGGDGDPASATRMTSTSVNFLAFGSGRHACPGRFWAAIEMKAMMAYMVIHYDMRMAQDGVVPEETWIASALLPDRKARMLFRRRAVQHK
ncbi:cytochrome P450 [Auricularia subglabra TFB-10046 SS5]|nr:cytochrome P450 [Auricularia subglabra TFB-10046 SS5]